LTAAIVNQRFRGPAQHVDEAGCDGESADVDFGGSGGASDVAHRNDRITVDRNITTDGCTATPIVDVAVAQDQVIARR
jgi:hypothetical protein